MGIYNLTPDEVDRLIKSLKAFKENTTFESPILGRIKDDTPLTDHENQIEYKFHRYRHPLDSTRFSLHIRFTESNDHLIRLDINNGTHRNPDGTKIEQNHLHIYNRKLERKDVFAIPLPEEIRNIETIFDAMADFFEYTNVTYSGGERNDISD